ncbi:MAG TPA: fructosamine kinase family protein [Natronosporangium sp.]|nr:fructosamine kinase family protein [Natronosporangium sp.]
MDLAYLRAHPKQLPTLLRHQRIRETPVPGGSICDAARLTLDDGASLFVKTWPAGGEPPDGFFAAEAAGLRWLAEPGAVAVPEVVAALPDLLALEWVPPEAPSAAAAERFGRELAALHRAGADSFGAPWPGFIGRLPQENTPHAGPWSEWFAQYRLAPHLRTSADRGALTAADVALVERVIARIGEHAADEPPARIHGDLWPGNVLWSGGRAWLVDPAAQGGHRETDLATLELFGGAPHLARIRSAYQEVWPLAPGWQARVPLHQLHLMLVHTAIFGAGWRDAVVTTARAALASG